MVRPVFFDASGRRQIWLKRLTLLVLGALALACAAFASTVITVPAPLPLPIAYERMSPLPFRTQVSRIKHKVLKLIGARPALNTTRSSRPLTVAFYTSWSDNSAQTLARHINQVDWVAPTLFTLDRSGRLVTSDDGPLRRVMNGSLHRPLVVPVVQNIRGGIWDGAGVSAVLRDGHKRAALIAQISAALDRSGDDGVIYDFESLTPAAMADLVKLVAETRRAFAPQHRVVSVTMPIDDPHWPARDLARAADRLILMAYDEHWQGGVPGPIASKTWLARQLGLTLTGVERSHIIVALGNYAYDWHNGRADSLTVEEAWLAARDSGAKPVFDKQSGNLGLSYAEDGKRHDIWLLDAATAWNQMQLLTRLGLSNIALWRLGSEDPGFWTALKTWREGRGRPALEQISHDATVDVEGQGEILRVAEVPHAGQRSVTFSGTGAAEIVSESYDQLPSPYVVQRTGARDHLVSLTFDDGPDSVWTPRILSVLERYHVPATFFVIGENGVQNGGLLKRIVADGDEIGNHSYTHPNMAEEATLGIQLELNATQRLVEAWTGRSTRLFRAPYFGDAEPTTADELGPALVAQQHGYTVVGLHVDPADWKTPGAPEIARRAIEQVTHPAADRSANVILLHDGGGDRAQTVAALPAIITGLQGAGYRFVPASTLAGLSRDTVMPRVTGTDLLAVQADVAAFSLLSGIGQALNWIFFLAIALGMVRAIGLTVLAARPLQSPPGDQPALQHDQAELVSVIIPAFNEERVIEASIRRILESDWPNIEVIVADDGSQDSTSAIVSAMFGEDPRVRLMTLVNGGKASALNRALKQAQGSIIVALDADTQFERSCIGRLVRWFADPEIGAVAGNAKVGNRVNLVTRWQAVEYVTAQNIERRALTRFDAIMVVPGAVGAWRRAALDMVGGYPEDTLAEDQDLTIAVQRCGWKVAYDEEAVAWTEAPETFAALAKQRFRWSFGTLQCLWKHRRVLREGHPSGLALVGIPQAWLFQIVFAVVSPLIDLALLGSIAGTVLRVFQHGWAQTQTDVLRMGAYWLAFTAVDAICGWFAYRLDVRERRFPVGLLLAQRFIYRQLMYWVVLKAVTAALGGLGIGWGKLDRTGRVSAPGSGDGHHNPGEQAVAPGAG
ncbi:MAG: glycosyltransferase [Sphingomonadaceae bacterium]|nr:glycosyltransferase [Sphingomonadaceae bacterium]